MGRETVASSNIESVGYDPRTQTLEVAFLSGAVYQYYGIPAGLHEELMRAGSKGRFLHLYIKDRYPYSRVG